MKNRTLSDEQGGARGQQGRPVFFSIHVEFDEISMDNSCTFCRQFLRLFGFSYQWPLIGELYF